MPKVDRAAQLQKQSAKAFKKLAPDAKEDILNGPEKRQAVKAAQEAVEDERLRAAKARKNGKVAASMEGKSAFAKASLMNEESSDDDTIPDYALQDARAKAAKKEPSEPTSPAATKTKKKAVDQRSELEILDAERRDARKKRIAGRLLRLFVVGYFLPDRTNGADSGKPKKVPDSGKPKKSKGATNGVEKDSIFKKVDLLGGPFLMLALTVLIMGVRMMEEGYTPMSLEDQVNFYEELGLGSDATIPQVRKAYKGLAVKWHPDKNPNCEACVTKFAKISKAYDTLSDPERKAAFDGRRGAQGQLVAAHSTELAAENFEVNVLRSNEVWIVQIYDPSDHACGRFHPIWEDVSSSKKNTAARFGRIDVTRSGRGLSFLPQRIMVTPTIFRFARGLSPQLYESGFEEEEKAGPFKRFVENSFPAEPRLESAGEVKSFWARQDRPRLLVGAPRKEGMNLELRRVAHVWAEFFDLAFTDLAHVKEALGPGDKAALKDMRWAVAARAEGADAKVELVTGDSADELPARLLEAVTQLARGHAPFVTVRTLHQLCGQTSAAAVRTFCLVLVDADDAAASKAIVELNSSRTAYAQELQELRASSEEEVSEEAFHIQPVRVTTSGSRLPWMPSPADHPAFHSVWEAAGRAPAFLVELETRRVAAVRGKGFMELSQQIAYDDLRFTELPETLPLEVAFPDPESTLRDELRHALSTGLGAAVAYTVVAVLASVLPELSLPAAGGTTGAVLFVIMLAWPAACRRLLGFAMTPR